MVDEVQGFDLRTHITDPKTGRVVKHQPYRIVGDKEGVTYIREGKKYAPNGTYLGPVDGSVQTGGKVSGKTAS